MDTMTHVIADSAAAQGQRAAGPSGPERRSTCREDRPGCPLALRSLRQYGARTHRRETVCPQGPAPWILLAPPFVAPRGSSGVGLAMRPSGMGDAAPRAATRSS